VSLTKEAPDHRLAVDHELLVAILQRRLEDPVNVREAARFS
jgi:hypothetical protein